MDSPVHLLLKKLILKTYLTEYPNDTILTQNSSDDINICFTELENFDEDNSIKN